MAKKGGTKIDDLYVTLGVETSGLDADLLSSSKTIEDGIANINQKLARNKIQLAIDQSKLSGAENAVEALTNKEKHLTDALNLQRQKVLLVEAAYKEKEKAAGKAEAQSSGLYTKLMREQAAEAKLAAQIREVNRERQAGANTAPMGIKEAGGMLSGIPAIFGKITGGVAAVGAAIASLVGFRSVVEGAVTAGEATYKLSEKLHLTASEAGELGRMLKFAEVDTSMFASTMIRLDRSIENAGKSGNDTTRALKDFGISLVDANGQLLPMNRQLEQLAIGYKKAAESGQEEEFVARVLGARGQALIPILERYTEVASMAGRTKGFIDPEKAHEANENLKELDANVSKLKNGLASVFLTVINDDLPKLNQLLERTTKNWKNLIDKITEARKKEQENSNGPQGLGTDSGGKNTPPYKGGGSGPRGLLNDSFGVQNIQELDPVSGVNIRAIKEVNDAKKAENSKQVEAQEKAEEELREAVFKATHSTIENQIHDIEKKREAARLAGVDEVTRTKLFEQAKAEIMKEVASNQIQLQDIILKSQEKGLEARLNEIDREKKAWLDKCQDEVKVAQWAEEMKRKAIEDSINATYGAEVSAVADAIKKGESVSAAYRKAHEEAVKNREARDEAQRYVREELGIQVKGDETNVVKYDDKGNVWSEKQVAKETTVTTPGALQTNGNVITQLAATTSKLATDFSKILDAGAIREQARLDIGKIEITVNTPAVNTELDMTKLADQTAGMIADKLPKVTRKGGVSNTY